MIGGANDQRRSFSHPYRIISYRIISDILAGTCCNRPMKRGPETDADAFKQQLRFVRKADGEENAGADADTDADAGADDRLTKAAKAFEAQLYREYALADLSRHQSHQIGLRWRTAGECQAGKGETSCGALDCAATEPLTRIEVPFTYREAGTKLTTLVKITVCPSCEDKVTFIARRERDKQKKKKKKKMKKKQRRKEVGRAEKEDDE